MLAGALKSQNDHAGALAEDQAALTIAAQLAEKHPANADWQFHLAVHHNDVGVELADQGDLPAALKEYRAGLAGFAELTAKDSGNAIWQGELGMCSGIVVCRPRPAPRRCTATRSPLRNSSIECAVMRASSCSRISRCGTE